MQKYDNSLYIRSFHLFGILNSSKSDAFNHGLKEKEPTILKVLKREFHFFSAIFATKKMLFEQWLVELSPE
jgi:hypothetical protein